MKTMQKSYGNKLLAYVRLAIVLLTTGLVACETTSKSAKTSTPEVTPYETSLVEDKQEIEELRKDIPPEKRDDNDQLKEILSLMGEVKDPPERIRSRFYKLTEKLRTKQRKEAQKRRDAFNKQEKKSREDFYKNQKKTREKYYADKKSKEERKEFYDKQDTERKEFTSDERDKRAEFNSDMKQVQDDFSTLMRDRNTEFAAAMREYTQRYNDFKKKKEEEKKMIGVPPGTPTTPLHTGDGSGQ